MCYGDLILYVNAIERKTSQLDLWNPIKHKIDLFKMKDDVQGELSLHNHFNPSTTITTVKAGHRGVSPESM